jgi:hypothetical protein
MTCVTHAVLALVAACAITGVAASPARAASCPASSIDGVRILELEDGLGCAQGAELASYTVLDGGYYEDDVHYCRWGQGGTRPIERRGRTFYAGFCIDKTTEVEATFLARPPLKTCRDRSLDDLRARYIGCPTARKVYRRSLTVALRENSGDRITQFRYAGYSWRCRARNPHKRHGNPAWYEWICYAPHDVRVHYRWFGGE